MELLDYIFRPITIIYSLVLVTLMDVALIESRFSRRVYWTSAAIVTLTCCCLIVVLYVAFGLDTVQKLSPLVSTVPSLVYYWYMAKYRGFRFILAFCTADMACMAAIMLSLLLSMVFGGGVWAILLSRVVVLIPMTIFMVKFVSKPYREITASIQSGWGAAAFVSLLFYALLYGYFLYPSTIEKRPQAAPVGILIIILLFSVYGFIYQTILRLNKIHQAELVEEMLRLQVALQTEQSHAMQDKMQADQAFRHDIRHHANLLVAMLNECNYDQAIAYTKKLGDYTLDAAVKRYSENLTVNAILSAHLDLAVQKGIRVTCKANVPQGLPIDEMKFCVILSNLLENAVENCTPTMQTATARLDVSIVHNSQLCIRIQNSFSGIIKRDSQGAYLSTKPTGGGIGLKSVRTLVDMYNGVLDISHADDTFTVYVALNQ